MPLIDDIFGNRQLNARQQESVARDQLAALVGAASMEPERSKREVSPTTEVKREVSSKSVFSDMLASLTSVGSNVSSQLDSVLTTRAPQVGAAAKAASTSGINISAPAGSGKYARGRGDQAYRQMAASIAASKGWSQAEFDAWDSLIQAESSWNPNAQNPTSTAYGFGQFLNSTWKPYGQKTPDPQTQLAYMARYISDRYGSPSKALAFHRSKNWY